MTGTLTSVSSAHDRRERAALPLMLVAGLNLAAVVAGAMLWNLNGIFVGFALTAWLLGVRHAFDVDHIAAIDNATRQLRHQQRGARWTGALFALGHSTVVVAVTVLVTAAATHFHSSLISLQHWGAPLGAAVSAVFLTLMGLTSLALLRRRLGSHGSPRAGQRRTWRIAWQPWQIFGVGMLFGLGFDTATEIALLVLSVGAVQTATLPLWAVLSLPGLFAAGMTLMDTIEGLLMLRAYEWALDDRNRTLRLNTGITAASALLALGVAVWQWWTLLAPLLGHSGEAVKSLPAAAMLGAAATCAMLLFWGVAVARRQIALTAQSSD